MVGGLTIGDGDMHRPCYNINIVGLDGDFFKLKDRAEKNGP